MKGYFRRGTIRNQLKQKDAAIEDFKQVLLLDPNNKEAINELRKLESASTSNLHNHRILNGKSFSSEVIVPKPKIELPQQIPDTSFQFECDWRELKGVTNILLRQQYLKMTGPVKIYQLFANSLEPNVFSEILETIADMNDLDFIFELLSNLTQIERFNTLTMFLSDSEKSRKLAEILSN